MVLDANKNGVPDNLEKPGTKTNTPTYNPNMSVPAVTLPGLTRGAAASEAYNWFKFVAAKAAKGTVIREYYDNFTRDLARLGIPRSKWNSVWKDAVDWTQTPGSGSNGNPAAYLAVLDPLDYADKGSEGPKYGTRKQKQITTNQYSPSQAGSAINQMIESEIGRTATKEEIDAYLAGVNAAAKKSPSISSQTITTAPGKGNLVPAGAKSGAKATSPNLGSTTIESTESGGFDPSMYALNFARSRPDFAESFATKAVLGIIQKVLKDPNAIGNVVE
jgi:hypothetical protein